MPEFVHLHVHSEFSLLDGLCKLPQLVDKAKSYDQKALALTDHGAMYGSVHFFNACLAAGIKPIIGVEIYHSATSRLDKQTRIGADQFHLIMLAKNFTGYQNIMRMVSIAHLEGFSYKPRIDLDTLKKYHEGVLILSACNSGIIAKKLLANNHDEAVHWANQFLEIFGEDFFIEIQSHPQFEPIENVRPALIDLAKHYGIPLVATNDVHYINQDDAEAQDALLAIQTRKTLDDPNRLSMLDSPDFYLKSTAAMWQELGEYPEALTNTVRIAESCNVTIPTGKMIFPKYPLPTGETPEAAFKKMCLERLPERFPQPTQVVLDRLNYEIEVISKKGYASYFLIVQDFINWAKTHGIKCGPGRGSAAGSLASYVLRITSIDPLVHGLPFERFMNPERPSPPDIDCDIADEHRDDVIRYVAAKYGDDHVAQIITFGTMEARAAIRDIGRVLGMPYNEPDKIAKAVPPKMPLEQAIVNSLELQEYYKDPRYKKLLDLAKKVEGNSRHASVHAAGVVIADQPLTNYTPIQIETKGGKVITQYDMYALDLNISETAIGLLKMDFLGLRNLSILGEAIAHIKATTGEDIDISRIPLDDQKVFDAISAGDTTGIFQLESGGMRRVARNLKPTRFSDLTAMVALYRPGPMELIDTFIAGKANPATIKYPHPDLKPVLEETYGIPVYQEQVLQMANVFAGYSLGQADILRRAIGKKKKYILDKEKKNFVSGAVKKGYQAKKAEEIWAFIEKFAGYGFNKAHSASYAMIAYQTAYLKVNYPVEYMCALLSVESHARSVNREERISQAIEECRRLQIPVLPPDINASKAGFSIEKDTRSPMKKAIRFGFTAIKNVGESAIEAILSNRGSEPYQGLTDFCLRSDSRKVNKKVLESLIRSGTFDSFGHRGQLLDALDFIKDKLALKQKVENSGQDSLFSVNKSATKMVLVDTFSMVPDLPDSQKLHDEKELLGIYLSTHPLTAAVPIFESQHVTKIGELDPLQKIENLKLGGMLTRVRQVQTKKSNATMAFATLEDMTGTLETVIFPRTFEAVKDKLELNRACIFSGKLEIRDDSLAFILDDLQPVFKEATEAISGQVITVPRTISKESLKQIGDVLKSHPGSTVVHIKMGTEPHAPMLKLPYGVAFTPTLKQSLELMVK